MADISIPPGPIGDEPYDAIRPVGRERQSDANRAALSEALAGIELGSYDRRIVAALAGQDGSTVAVICSWLQRARAALPDGVIVLPEPAELGLPWTDGGDLLALRGPEIVLFPDGADEWTMGATTAREIAAQLAAMAQVLDERAAGGGA
ncbi:hypothetical protein GCM10009555_018300 [Acrocarpospora macrocephala]|uniref:Uncharacterized protein n=1 Tax=Acrocarpospora macrocephala TaxID=150177 RepID=A0A5M3WGR7_9ACTN|nr:hypothetical protein [Acrocarpospora macrocephala]GES07490.1 hypothetical protein Amac_010850 [Acrocarpospora macrocephala]